jgi:hypothetical protein
LFVVAGLVSGRWIDNEKSRKAAEIAGNGVKINVIFDDLFEKV